MKEAEAALWMGRLFLAVGIAVWTAVGTNMGFHLALSFAVAVLGNVLIVLLTRKWLLSQIRKRGN